MKDKIISKIITGSGKVIRSPKKEQIAVSNLFGSKVQRNIRKNYPLEREYWIEIKK
jgi:hypothetical protein